MANRFELDHAGLRSYLREDPELAEAVRNRADLAAEFARQIAPVGSPPDDESPGRYRDSIEVGAKELTYDRLSYPISTDVPHEKAVERRHHVMRRVRAAFSDPKGGRGL